ncbi:hypothetical protein FALBO_10614 [Fusarium albosuccineum]|uniref:Thioesterase domain-containing protein n=1 Tax=Fusarium albosuccineum TaxID=1237068 RepID=A0A8H4L796_9HYPO|nr:hypothetical protein FALBO_10614 [Fusarium albosuccineum]
MSSQEQCPPSEPLIHRTVGHTEDLYVRLPADLLSCFKEWDKRLIQLRNGHPWLRELDKELDKRLDNEPNEDFRKSSLSNLQQEFLTNGHSPILRAIIESAFADPRSTISVDHVFLGRKEGVSAQNEWRYLAKNQSFDQSFLNAIRTRCDELIPEEEPRYFDIEKDVVISRLKKGKELSALEADTLSELERWINIIDLKQPETMSFGFRVSGIECEPYPLLSSIEWRKIGRNLRALGLPIGADMPRFSEEIKPVTLMTALRNVVNGEVTTVNAMLARIEEQHDRLQRQQKAITALQFRRLLEHLPRTLRPTAADAAEKWDKMKEAERWCVFWERAVEHVYKHEKEKTWTSSPFAELLKNHLDTAKIIDEENVTSEKGMDRSNGEAAAVKWLANGTDLGRHVKELYSTLSQIIHQFSDGRFTVEDLHFNPLDVQILKALIPNGSGEKNFSWEEESQRYIAAWHETAGIKVESKILGQAAITRAEGLWESLQTKAPFPGVLPRKLSQFSGTSDPPRITALYKLDDNHINPDKLLHSVVVAMLVDSIGRIALEASEGHMTDGRTEVRFSNPSAASSGDEIEVSGTALQIGKKKDRHWSINVEIKVANGGQIAKGCFKAWKV